MKKIILGIIGIIFILSNFIGLSLATGDYIVGGLATKMQAEARKKLDNLSDTEKQELANKYTNGDVNKLYQMVSDGKAGPITKGVLSYKSNCIKLNTNIPGVGNCIKQDQAGSAFSNLMSSMMKLLVNITVAVAFIAIIASGVMMTTSGVSQSTAGKGKELLKKVILGIVLLGLSGLILHTINPNFFKTGLTFQLIKKLKN